jgi:DNA-binding transcriptional MerR regulator
MTIGQLSRRTGVPIKILREYEDRGFLYTLGRSAGNYRLFGEEALWCVQNVQGLRSLGLTLTEIEAFVTRYRAGPDESIGPYLEDLLRQVVLRLEERIAALQAQRHRVQSLLAVGSDGAADPPAPSLVAQVVATDPRRGDGQTCACRP